MRRKTNGFTMVELLITLAIVAVIIAISANGLILQQKKARDARRKADLQEIRAALEQYRTISGFYRDEGEDVSGYSSITQYFDNSVIPSDPKKDEGYKYKIEFGNCTGADCGTYELGSTIEQFNPPPASCLAKPCEGTADSCYYCVTQP